MISGLVVLSEPSWGCYPYIESIQSFLSSVDELVVAFNVYGRNDGSREKIEALNSAKIRIVPTVFDIEKYGWVTYGIARTMGYQACKGDVVLMFDADGILHEDDVSVLETQIKLFLHENWATGYWNKYRTYKPTVYYNQHKHSGIYNKKILGDRLDFFRPDGKGAPNFIRLTEQERKSKQFPIFLFGYEHVWDTMNVLKTKVNRYGRMIDRIHNHPFKTPEEYFDTYMKALVKGINEKGKGMSIDKHPAIIQKKLKEVNKSHFGYDFFGYK